MNKTANTTMILTRLLVRVKPSGNCQSVATRLGSGTKWLCAIHHLASNTVWFSQVTSPVRVMEKINLLKLHPDSPVKRFGKALQKVLDDHPHNQKMDVYFGKPEVLFTTSLVRELEAEDSLVRNTRVPPKNNQQVWLITHKPTGHYILKRVSQKGTNAQRVLMAHLRCFKPDSPYAKVLGRYSLEFAIKHGITEESIDDFDAVFLQSFRKPSDTANFINQYVQTHNAQLCLNMDGVKMVRHRLVRKPSPDVEVMEVAAAYSPTAYPHSWQDALAKERRH